MSRLENKVVIVTGAGSIGPGWGNGKAAAVLFAREGAKVLACDINPDAAAETRALIEAEGGTCEAVTADVSSGEAVKTMVAQCLARFGRIDVLHNNVGIFKVGGPPDLSEEDWEAVIATNLRSPYLTCRHVLPVMVKQGGGAIVNIGSIAGLRFMGLPLMAYSTSKGAIISFTQSIAAQYGPQHIRANCVVPGIIDTPVMRIASGDAYAARWGADTPDELHAARAATIPLGVLGSAWDVAHASAFLASDDAAYITGAVLMVDGGLSLMTPQPPTPDPKRSSRPAS